MFNRVLNTLRIVKKCHCVKSVRIWSFSGLYFPAFGLNTVSIFSTNAGKYGPEKLRIRTLFMQWVCLNICYYFASKFRVDIFEIGLNKLQNNFCKSKILFWLTSFFYFLVTINFFDLLYRSPIIHSRLKASRCTLSFRVVSGLDYLFWDHSFSLQIFRKINIFYPVTRTRTYAY